MSNTELKNGEWTDDKLFFYDKLPPGFENWLEFYDNIPIEYQEAETVQFLRFYDSSEVMRIFEVVPIHRDTQVQVVHSVRREYLLARLAERLLSARLSKETLNTIMLKLRVSNTTDYSINHAEYLLSPLWEVATSK